MSGIEAPCSKRVGQMNANVGEASRRLDMDEASRRAMEWYGWGSAVGLGLFILFAAAAAALILIAIHL